MEVDKQMFGKQMLAEPWETMRHRVASDLQALPKVPPTVFSPCWWWWCLFTKSHPTLLQPHRLQPTMLLCPWDFPGKNTGVGCHFPFQGIF